LVLWPLWDEGKAVAASNAWLIALYSQSESVETSKAQPEPVPPDDVEPMTADEAYHALTGD
jgi:hypothetical protein